MFLSWFRFSAASVLASAVLLFGCGNSGGAEPAEPIGEALSVESGEVLSAESVVANSSSGSLDLGAATAVGASAEAENKSAKGEGDDRDPTKKPPSPDFEDKSGPKGVTPGSGPKKNDDRKWVSSGSVKLGRSLTVTGAIGKATCCSSKKVAHEGAPLRVYIAPLNDAALEGYVLFLGAEDRAVLMGQSKTPGVYDRAVYRSAGPMARSEDGGVTLSVPAAELPKGDLKAWAGVQAPVTIAGVLLGGKQAGSAEKKEDPDVPKPKKDVPVPTAVGKSGSGEQPSAIPFVTLTR
jgi:hypothetical protein